MDENKFKELLEHTINKCSMESASNTPDFILAEFLFICLEAWNKAMKQREAWYANTKPTT